MVPVIGIATTEIAGYSAVEYGRNLYGASRSSQLERMDDGYFYPQSSYTRRVGDICGPRRMFSVSTIVDNSCLPQNSAISFPIGPSDLDIRAWQGIQAA